MLLNLKILRASDAPAFMVLCESFGRYANARDELEKRGYTYDAETVTGGTMRRIDPLYAVLDRERRMILNFAERFGMTPVDRQRVLSAVAGGGPMMTSSDPKTPPRDDVNQIDLLPESAGSLSQPGTVGSYKDVTDE
jgi:P27 family predicted phage terminase small subunit